MMWSDKNVKMENYGNLWKKIFSCICVIGIQQQKAGEGTASLQVPSLALTSELKFISQSISKQSDFWVKPPFFSSLLFLFLQHSQAASLELLVPGRGARAGWDGEETGQEGTECLTTVIKEHK